MGDTARNSAQGLHHSYCNTYFYSDGYTDRFSTTYSYA